MKRKTWLAMASRRFEFFSPRGTVQVLDQFKQRRVVNLNKRSAQPWQKVINLSSCNHVERNYITRIAHCNSYGKLRLFVHIQAESETFVQFSIDLTNDIRYKLLEELRGRIERPTLDAQKCWAAKEQVGGTENGRTAKRERPRSFYVENLQRGERRTKP